MSSIMRDDALDLFGVEDVVGQVVVDLGVRQVAALLAEHDQLLQARLRASTSAGVSSTLRGSTPPFLPLRPLPSASASSVRLPADRAAISPADGLPPARLRACRRPRRCAPRLTGCLPRRLAVAASPAFSTASTRARPAPWAPAWPACLAGDLYAQAWPTGLWPSAPGFAWRRAFSAARDRLLRRGLSLAAARAGAPKLARGGLPGRLGAGLGLAARLRRPGRFGLGLDARFPDGLRVLFGHDHPTSCGADLVIDYRPACRQFENGGECGKTSNYNIRLAAPSISAFRRQAGCAGASCRWRARSVSSGGQLDRRRVPRRVRVAALLRRCSQ